MPLALRLFRRLRPVGERLFAPDWLARQRIVRPAVHGRYDVPHLSGTREQTWEVWAGLMFQLWHLTLVEHAVAGRPAPDLSALGG